MMRHHVSLAALCMAVVASACSDTGPEGPGTTGDDKTTGGKRVERVELPDSRFKPTALEATIETIVTNIEDAEEADEISLGVVLKELNNFWRPVVVGANRALGELEIAGAVQGNTASGNQGGDAIEQQLHYIEEQRQLGLSGLGIAPHGGEIADAIDALVDEGKPVITIDSDLPDSKRHLYIGTDNTRGGKTGGETLVDLLDGKTGRVIVLGYSGEDGWVDGTNRTNAAADVLRAAGNEVQIVDSVWDGEEEVDNLVAAIEDETYEQPVVGMLGVFANAHACATAALEVNLEEMPKIVAFDFEPSTLTYMEDGVIHATHVQRQYYMGYLSMYLLYSIKTVGLEETKDSVSAHLLNDFHLDTGLDVIFAQDLSEYNAFVDELGI